MRTSLQVRGAIAAFALLCVTLSPSGAAPAESPLGSALKAAMDGRSGTAVVVELSSGRVLGAHNFDLAAHRLATPGSTVKTFVLLDLLHKARIDPNARLACPRTFPLGKHRLDCTHPAVPPMSAQQALAWSCNYYFVRASEKLTDNELRQALLAAGLSSPTGTPGEVIGHIDTPRTPEERALLALGESNIEITPLELLHAYRKLALERSAQSSGALAVVFAGLDESVEYGMASTARNPHLSISGKTGTSVAPGNTTHGWFVGFAPARNPEIAFIVYLERGRGRDAAAIAARALEAYTPTVAVRSDVKQ
jgi:cell division protein FtsI/penicillin-binding protein 2